MRQKGIVIEKKEETLTIQIQRGSACGNCKGCSGKDTCLNITVKGQAEVGDEVLVDLPDGQIAKASLLAYGIPLLGMIGGFVVGTLLSFSEGITILLALGGLGVAALVMMWVDKKIKNKKNWVPQLVEVIKTNL